MDERIKGMWVDALLSGEYKKGRHMLHDEQDDTYCCLGVLCELAKQEGAVDTYSSRSAWLPLAVQRWALLPNEQGHLRGDVSVDSLAWINDTNPTFDEVIREIKDYA